jgi:hypothetical protein
MFTTYWEIIVLCDISVSCLQITAVEIGFSIPILLLLLEHFDKEAIFSTYDMIA